MRKPQIWVPSSHQATAWGESGEAWFMRKEPMISCAYLPRDTTAINHAYLSTPRLIVNWYLHVEMIRSPGCPMFIKAHTHMGAFSCLRTYRSVRR